MNKKFNAILVSDAQTIKRIKKMAEDDVLDACCPWSTDTEYFSYTKGPCHFYLSNQEKYLGFYNSYCNSCRKVMKVVNHYACPCNYHSPEELDKILKSL